MKKITLFFVLFFYNSYSQNNEDFANTNSKDFTSQVLIYNIGINSIMGGIGSMINKPKDVKLWNAFLRGAGYGALGGLVKYQGKNLSNLIITRKTPEYAWLSKGVFFAGNSIVENAASYRKPFEQWHFNISFLRFEFHTKNDFKFYTKIQPIELGLTIYSIIDYAEKFDSKLSLQTGNLVFKLKEKYTIDYGGLSIGNNIFLYQLEKNIYYNQVFAHEHIHLLQHNEFTSISNIFENKLNKINFLNKNKDWLYLDLNIPFFALLYYSQHKTTNVNDPCYFDNYFEGEALFLGEGLKLPKCN